LRDHHHQVGFWIGPGVWRRQDNNRALDRLTGYCEIIETGHESRRRKNHA
jgi:hypothetical protein